VKCAKRKQGGPGIGRNQGAKNGNARLTREQADTVRELLARKTPQRKIAALFGVCQHTIHSISIGRTWTTYLSTGGL
jgi:DNA invertase Pin-like site-specific DNA recombinase